MKTYIDTEDIKLYISKYIPPDDVYLVLKNVICDVFQYFQLLRILSKDEKVKEEIRRILEKMNKDDVNELIISNENCQALYNAIRDNIPLKMV